MSAGHAFRNIRRRLGVSQVALSLAMQCTRQNVSLYERGQRLPTDKARMLIVFANELGLAIGFDHVYGDLQLPEMPRRLEAA